MTAREHRHEERDDLTGEHRLADGGQLVLAVLFFAVWIVDSFAVRLTTFLNAQIPIVIRIPIAAVLVALAGYMAWASHRIIFGDRREKPHVVRRGVFGVVRHPMYLSEILLYLGLLLLSLSLMAGGIWFLSIAFLHYIARKEENLLLKRFGDEYARYMRDIPMWLPYRWRT